MGVVNFLGLSNGGLGLCEKQKKLPWKIGVD